MILDSQNAAPLSSIASGATALSRGGAALWPSRTGDMKKIRLGSRRGKVQFTIVDDDDFALASSHPWRLNSSGYATTNIRIPRGGQRTLTLHRMILRPSPGLEVDHINGDRLDNRRSNLRAVTKSQNHTNRQNRSNPNGGVHGRGVAYDRKNATRRWRAYARLNGKQIFGGYFNTREEASVRAAQLRLQLGYLDATDAALAALEPKQ